MFENDLNNRSLSSKDRDKEDEVIKVLPKIELHLHLDCSLSYNVVKKLDPTVTVEQYKNEFVAPPKCEDLMDFLKRAVKGFQLMQTKEALQLVVEDLFEQLKKDHVIYAEIRFAPLLHLEKGLSPYEVVQAVEAATAEAVSKSGVEARVILCTLRHYTEEQSMTTVKLVEEFAGTYIAGFDIAGDEAGCPVTNHIKAFQYAQQKGLPITAHGGEAAGAESVWQVLEHFKPSRIGHGARSVEDERLVQHLRDKKIHLEMCPSCNVQTSMYQTYKDHPVDTLKKQGVLLNINTDCRTIVDVDLNTEYKRLQQHFGWTKKDFYECNVNAVKAAFIPDGIKAGLLQKLSAAYQ